MVIILKVTILKDVTISEQYKVNNINFQFMDPYSITVKLAFPDVSQCTKAFVWWKCTDNFIYFQYYNIEKEIEL